METSNSEYPYEIQVELWENQRYKPLQGGWGPAFSSSSIPNFSDLMAKVSIHPFNPMEDDGIPLPQGWEWIDDAWQPELLSSYYGEIDEEGWSYASSFDRLIHQTCSRSLLRERSHVNIYRRRRWYRRRQCVDPQLNTFYQERKQWIQTYCLKMMEEANRHSISFQTILEYHDNWKKALSPLIHSIELMRDNLLQNFEYLQKNLLSLQQFLMELGLIEQQYANKLEDLSSKWKVPRIISPTYPNDARYFRKEKTSEDIKKANEFLEKTHIDEFKKEISSEKNATSHIPLSIEQTIESKTSFFELISQFHTKLSFRKANLASLIHDSLLHDVMSLIEESNELTREYSLENTKNWKNYESKFQDSEFHRQTLQQMYQHSITYLQEVKRGYIESLGRISIFQNTEENIPLYNDHIFVSEFLSSNLQCNSLKKDLNDPWVGLVQYSIDVLQVNGHLFVLNAFYKSMLSKSFQFIELSSRFLQSLMKLFVHQQYLLYQEAMNIYQIVGQSLQQSSHTLHDLDDQLHPPIPLQSTHLKDTDSAEPQSYEDKIQTIEDIDDITEFILSKRQDVMSLLAPFKSTLKHIVKYGIMDYLLLSQHLKLNWNQPLSIFEQSDSLKYFQSALVILTYDHQLHLIPIPESLQSQRQQNNNLKLSKLLLIQSILSLKEWNAIASFQLNTWSVAIEPFYIPQEDYRDSLLVSTGISNSLINNSMINRTKRGTNRRPSMSFSTSRSSFSDFSLLSSTISNIQQGIGQGIILVNKYKSSNNPQEEILQWIKALLHPFASFDQPMPDMLSSMSTSSKMN